MQLQTAYASEDAVQVINASVKSSLVLVCEHASAAIPAELDGLGLSKDAAKSHAAWDPGALAVAQHMSAKLDAVLVASRISRLVYDCNRPPEAADAMPAKSEIFDIPGNTQLSEQDRAERAEKYYYPFRTALARQIALRPEPVIVTMHSFTPVYAGQSRSVEIGILHDTDSRLADAMLACSSAHYSANVERNAPYGPQDGVTHTLKEHALPQKHLNVMLEIRNDLISTSEEQTRMAEILCGWLSEALASLRANAC